VSGDGVTASYSRATGETVAGGPYHITATLSATVVGALDNYIITNNGASFAIEKRDASVTADNKGKTYGDDNPTLTATVTGTVNGDTLNYSLATTAVKFSSVGDYAITVTLGLNPNYNVTKTDGNLHISAKDASVTADNKGKTYGDDNPELTATVTGTVNGDTLNYSLATTAVKFSGVGDYAITVTLGLNPNYNVTKTDGNLHINAKDASVTADNKGKTYGDDNPTLTATVTGTVNGDTLNYSLATTAVKFSSVGDYTITVTLGSNPNYNVTKTDGNLHISPKDASVAADNKSKTYGDNNPALTATVTGTVNGDTLNYSLATTAVKFSSVGDYAITVTLGLNPNYNVTKTDGNLHINAKDASVTADNKSKTYGDLNPALTATVTGTVNGDTLNYSLSTTATMFSNVGDYGITVTLGLNPNYTVTFTNGTLHISQKDASVTADNKNKTYGQANPTLTATVTGTVNGDLLNYTLSTTATQFSNVGTYAITVTLGSNPNYNVTPMNGTLTVDPKALDITANDRTKTYGDAVTFAGTEFTTVAGQLVNGDTVTSVTLTSAGAAGTATVTAPGPTYNITPSAAMGTGLGNYTITYHVGHLTSSRKGLDITANNRSKTYGDTVTFAGTEFTTVAGQLVNGDTVTIVTLTSAGAAMTATVTAPGPTYNITPSAAVGTGLGNYTISYHNASVGLTVNPKGLDITANNRIKTYGDTVTFIGTEFTTGTGQLVNGNTVTSVTLTSTGAVATATVAGSPYAIVASAAVGTGLGNYTISYHNATVGLTVNRAHLTVTAIDKSKAYDGNPFTAFTATITGFKNGETVAVVSGSSTYTGSAVGATLPGTYTITPQLSTLNAANYDFPGPSPGTYFVNGTLTIGYGTCSGPNPGGVILQPINADGSSVFPRAGRTVPVKFTVCDANGNPISDPNVVFAGTGGELTMLSAVRGQIPNPDENQYNDIPDVAFRYTGGMWMFNMATSNLQSGYSYMFRINLKYGSITFVIAIK
jgi:hypothetical protein